MTTLERVFYSSPGQSLAKRAGLPPAQTLRRGRNWPAGAIVLASLASATAARDALVGLGLEFDHPVIDTPGDKPPGYGSRIGAIVVDATEVTTIDGLEDLRAVLRPAVRSLEPSGRVIILARPAAGNWEAQAVARALDGINRTVGKELRKGATANLVYVDRGASSNDLTSTLSFLLQGRSAFVDGQSWSVGVGGVETTAAEQPLAGKVIVVTGAARGIGASISRILARDGATIVAVDIPAAGQSLASVANEVGGTALHLDVTAADAGAKIAAHVAERGLSLYGIVHNAGITRDKMLVNTDADRWASVLQVNLAAQLRINDVLLDPSTEGGLGDNGRIVGIASTSGLAGNKGQANYAASKAGVAGLVAAMAPDLSDRGITVNAVAPGFIETDMTARIPFVQREVFRRTNSLAQGGNPDDVAETIGYLLDPASAGVSGQVIRVCGQNLVGA
ncbi:3-oxoacyl-ACP reductase [Demequina sp. TTPB684]|uniref:3-oxoacyl-ACP reductase n=1 Tax=unclassified Demequina TaxID=2620311 RepID=UPI001CF1FFCD|nr:MULTISPECIES: 3-oxoacyl-ACP reductase [unclassified Demequina]MCB2413789.1 3-oxoacyl-ACP reductase [Demequina sp. TTPB684]UPU89303.1 3-oxoacyl-ACP reductase [Demequina sp. TMPB413]